MNYFIKTFGCQMNKSDSERIATFLENHKLKPAKNIDQADLIIFNTCGVRQTAENRVYGQVHNIIKKFSGSTAKKSGRTAPFIVITGCLAHRKDVQKVLKNKVNLFISIKDFFNLPLFKGGLREFLDEDKQRNLPDHPLKKEEVNNNYFSIIPQYQNKEIASIPIMTGCNNFCSYCVVPYARGREWSRPPQDIFEEIDRLNKNSHKEITLLGQNVNSYSHTSAERGSSDCTTTFPQLLKNLSRSFSQIKFAFLTSHPKDFSDNLIKIIAQNKNISREIHLPVQSGSSKILKLMNRPYTQKKYLNLITRIKKQIPKVKISTDVIIGFPGETEKDFQETVKIFKEVVFFEAYINKYSPRPETAAFKLGDPISWEEKKRRERTLRKLIKK